MVQTREDNPLLVERNISPAIFVFVEMNIG